MSHKATQRAARRRGRRPRVEALEDRLLLYAFSGGEWTYGARITYSFAPDGTNVGGNPNTLNQAMAQRGISPQAWQDQFRRAAATWQAVANINLVEVPDNGAPFSTSGNQQSDSRFGDIRIAGINLSTGVLGMNFLPPPLNGGTLAGDIIMSTAIAWNVNSTYDLQTVALHEFGHALGLSHSSVATAVMYATYGGIRQSLHNDDVSGMQALYGARQPDRFDTGGDNNLYTRSTVITPFIDAQKQIRLTDLDITSSSDNDWYYVAAPAGTNNVMTVSVQSSQLSSLAPRIIVYDAALRPLTAVGSDSYGATVSASIGNVTPGTGFFLRVIPNSGNSPTGAYALLVNFGTTTMSPAAPPDTTVVGQYATGGITQSQTVPGGPQSQAAPGRARGNGNKALHEPERIEVGTLEGFGDDFTIPGYGHEHQPQALVARPDWAGVLVAPPIDAGGSPDALPSAAPAKGKGVNLRALDAVLGALVRD
jgi:predicted Zn-dependent protease